MTRCIPLLLVLLAAVPFIQALDCRKFSFAPACRGIMLKRSGGDAVVDEPRPLMKQAQGVSELRRMYFFLKDIENEAQKTKPDCVSVDWLRKRIRGSDA